MREALARIDQDFVLSEPRQRKGARQSAASSFLLKPLRAIQFAARHGNLMLVLLFAALLGAVLVNALVWQKTRHPAPLFGRSVPIEAKVEEKNETREIPRPAVRPIALQESVAAPAPAETPAAAPPHGRDPMAEIAALQNQKPAAAPARDPIAQLLKAPAAASVSAPAESAKTIQGVQRALMKLGFVVKPDGAMGSTTRQALEQFEHDHSLPAHGTLSPKVLRLLSSESGVAIE